MVARVDRHDTSQDVAPREPGQAREQRHHRRHLERAQHSSGPRAAVQPVAERAQGRNGDRDRQNGWSEHQRGLHPLEKAGDEERACQDQKPRLEA